MKRYQPFTKGEVHSVLFHSASFPQRDKIPILASCREAFSSAWQSVLLCSLHDEKKVPIHWQ